MFRAIALSVIVCLASLTFAQTTPLQIVYVVDGLTLSTYNVDSHTLQPTLVGTTTLSESVYPGLTTSPNGRIIYYTSYQDYSQQGERLYVYNTNGMGVPISRPIQTFYAKGDSAFVVDPRKISLSGSPRGGWVAIYLVLHCSVCNRPIDRQNQPACHRSHV